MASWNVHGAELILHWNCSEMSTTFWPVRQLQNVHGRFMQEIDTNREIQEQEETKKITPKQQPNARYHKRWILEYCVFIFIRVRFWTKRFCNRIATSSGNISSTTTCGRHILNQHNIRHNMCSIIDHRIELFANLVQQTSQLAILIKSQISQTDEYFSKVTM